eukprot:Rmarinus@m.23442
MSIDRILAGPYTSLNSFSPRDGDDDAGSVSSSDSNSSLVLEDHFLGHSGAFDNTIYEAVESLSSLPSLLDSSNWNLAKLDSKSRTSYCSDQDTAYKDSFKIQEEGTREPAREETWEDVHCSLGDLDRALKELLVRRSMASDLSEHPVDQERDTHSSKPQPFPSDAIAGERSTFVDSSSHSEYKSTVLHRPTRIPAGLSETDSRNFPQTADINHSEEGIATDETMTSDWRSERMRKSFAGAVRDAGAQTFLEDDNPAAAESPPDPADQVSKSGHTVSRNLTGASPMATSCQSSANRASSATLKELLQEFLVRREIAVDFSRDSDGGLQLPQEVEDKQFVDLTKFPRCIEEVASHDPNLPSENSVDDPLLTIVDSHQISERPTLDKNVPAVPSESPHDPLNIIHRSTVMNPVRTSTVNSHPSPRAWDFMTPGSGPWRPGRGPVAPSLRMVAEVQGTRTFHSPKRTMSSPWRDIRLERADGIHDYRDLLKSMWPELPVLESSSIAKPLARSKMEEFGLQSSRYGPHYHTSF